MTLTEKPTQWDDKMPVASPNMSEPIDFAVQPDTTDIEQKTTTFKGKEDPFAHEENSEVKYRTMTWW